MGSITITIAITITISIQSCRLWSGMDLGGPLISIFIFVFTPISAQPIATPITVQHRCLEAECRLSSLRACGRGL